MYHHSQIIFKTQKTLEIYIPVVNITGTTIDLHRNNASKLDGEENFKASTTGSSCSAKYVFVQYP